MASHDRLFIYTNGVTEAPSMGNELFGAPRLRRVLDAHAEASLAEIKSAVLQALCQHTQKRLSHDDVTFMAIEIRDWPKP